MPTYQYRCAKCGDQFEEWQSIHDAALKRHRGGCGGKLDKVLSVGGIVLKGSGFYKTDNRSSAKGGRPDGSKSDGAKPDSGSDSKSDTSSKEKSSSNGSGTDSSSSKTKDGTSSSTPSKSGASSS